jgi:hypothetical protein
MTPVIPPRGNRSQVREYDWLVYKERHLIERFFNKSNTTEESSRDTRREPVTTWAFFASSPLSSGYGDTSTEPRENRLLEHPLP